MVRGQVVGFLLIAVVFLGGLEAWGGAQDGDSIRVMLGIVTVIVAFASIVWRTVRGY